MAVSLQDLITAARNETGTFNSGYFDDTVELPQYANDAASTVYDRLVTAYEQYFSRTAAFSLASSNTIELTAITLTGPAFYKELGVNFSSGGRWVTVPPVGSYVDRNVGTNWPGFDGPALSYFINGSSLEILPATTSFAGSYQLVYIGNLPELTGSVGLPTEMERWKRLVILEMALKMKSKREQDTSELERKIGLANAEIDNAAKHRRKEGRNIPLRRGAMRVDPGPWGW